MQLKAILAFCKDLISLVRISLRNSQAANGESAQAATQDLIDSLSILNTQNAGGSVDDMCGELEAAFFAIFSTCVVSALGSTQNST